MIYSSMCNWHTTSASQYLYKSHALSISIACTSWLLKKTLNFNVRSTITFYKYFLCKTTFKKMHIWITEACIFLRELQIVVNFVSRPKRFSLVLSMCKINFPNVQHLSVIILLFPAKAHFSSENAYTESGTCQLFFICWLI